MNDSLDMQLLSRALIAIFAVFVLSKVVTYLLKMLVDKITGGGSGDKDHPQSKEYWDRRIDLYLNKMKIEQGAALQNPIINEQLKRQERGKGEGVVRKENKVDLIYQECAQYLKKIKSKTLPPLPSEEKFIQEAQTLMGLIDNLRWGEGKILQSIESSLMKNLSLAAGDVNVLMAANELLREGYFDAYFPWLNENKNENTLPDLPSVGGDQEGAESTGVSDLLELIKSKVIFDGLLSADQKKKEKFLLVLMQKYQWKEEIIQYVLLDFISQMEGKKEKEYNQQMILTSLIEEKKFELKVNQTTDTVKRKSLWKKYVELHRGKIHFTNLLFQLKASAEKISAMEERWRQFKRQHKIDSDDLIKAYHLLELSLTANEEEIKTSFNQLAKRNHPDRMMQMNLGEEQVKKVNERFSEIKWAYDLCKLWCKESKVFLHNGMMKE